MTRPEELQDDEGKWIRRDVLIDEMVEENPDADADEVRDALDEMISDGPMRAKKMDGTVYVQLQSRSAGVKALAKYRSQMAKDRVNDILGWN